MVLPRDHLSRHWEADRLPGRMPNDPNSLYQHRHPMDICTMLAEYCDIPLNHFIMAGITKDGNLVTFSGPKEASNPSVLSRYIDIDGYQQWYRTGGTTQPGLGPFDPACSEHGDLARHQIGSAYAGRRQYDRQRGQGLTAYGDDAFSGTRKRQRGGLFPRTDRRIMDRSPPPVQVALSKRALKIGNTEETWKFYDHRFKNIQQTACKVIAKAWVKLVAPKKQSNHPYTGADAKAPDWWPKPWGTSRDEKVRHKEPDHLYKPERVYLLNHILRMVTDPNNVQHKDIQKLNLNVSKLEEATFEALSGFLADTENPNNAKKKPYLKELFKVARFEERYKNGEVDADAEVFVMTDDKVPDNYQSEGDDDVSKDEDNPTTSTASSISPTSKISDHGLLVTSTTDPSVAGASHAGSFLGELPVRAHPYQQPSLMHPDLGAGQSGFVESGSIGVGSHQPAMSQAAGISLQEAFSDAHASSRRPSMYTSPSEYGNASTPGLYPGWHQTNPPTPSSVYSYSHHQQHQAAPPHQPGSYVDHQTVPLTQTPQFVGTASFDGIQRGAYDPGPTSMYRPASVPHAPLHSTASQSFSGYLQPDDLRSSLTESSLKSESLPRGHLQHEGGSSFDNKRWNS